MTFRNKCQHNKKSRKLTRAQEKEVIRLVSRLMHISLSIGEQEAIIDRIKTYIEEGTL